MPRHPRHCWRARSSCATGSGGRPSSRASAMRGGSSLTPRPRSSISRKAGAKRVDVVCPGFVADCLETLEEAQASAAPRQIPRRRRARAAAHRVPERVAAMDRGRSPRSAAEQAPELVGGGAAALRRSCPQLAACLPPQASRCPSAPRAPPRMRSPAFDFTTCVATAE